MQSRIREMLAPLVNLSRVESDPIVFGEETTSGLSDQVRMSVRSYEDGVPQGLKHDGGDENGCVEILSKERPFQYKQKNA